MYLISPDNSCFNIKNGNYIGRYQRPSTLSLTTASDYTASGVHSMNNYAGYIRSGAWKITTTNNMYVNWELSETSVVNTDINPVTSITSSTIQGTLVGNFVNSPTFSTSKRGIITLASASSQVISFGGSSLISLSTTDFAIEVWYSPTSLVATHPFIQTDPVTSVGTANCWYFSIISSTTLAFGLTSAIGTRVTASVNMVAGSWYHLVITRTSGVCAMYVNGASVAVSNASVFNGTSFTYSSSGGVIGYLVGTAYMNGSIGAIRVYKERSLTANEVYMQYGATAGRFA